MKKAIIATAVILVLSFISTVCFGVALGSQGLRAFLRDGGVLDEWTEDFSDWRDLSVYTEDWVDTDDRMRMFSSETTEIPVTDTLRITADCGDIRVMGGAGDNFEIVLEQYSNHANATSKYALSVESASEIRLTAAPDLDGTAAVLTVHVPQALTALTVETELGEVDIQDITVGTLNVHLNAGDLDLTACTLQNADLRVNTGEVDLHKSVTVGERLTLTCACGEADIEIPETVPFTLQYTVQTGNAEIESDIPSELLRSVQQNGASCKGELQRRAASGESGGLYDITVTLGNLEIGSGTDFDDD